MIVNTANGNICYRAELEHLSKLSGREKEILKLVQIGKISKEIAEQLFISVNTVNRHRQNILKKMSVSNITQACALAANLKWI
ncbi:helix-turn-helix domain-containing protein [Niabella hibiscisoli]|uniref:helix-turn-helix domain-containing protein n=1 Tax=Niabella hibiscisoli TaxID=1825928 RepID=UPI001F0E778D|nr:helix-turn-helix transcriptional regulator [Niabella hibiscisoli]MCH5719559.1 helix-turn-helix transcriptional regulator [Niabella hibiscisoli]